MNTIHRSRVYSTTDVARWFRVSVDEVRAWVRDKARLTPSGWGVVLTQMVGHRRRRRDPWRFVMVAPEARQGTSRPPTAARRAAGKSNGKGKGKGKGNSTGKGPRGA